MKFLRQIARGCTTLPHVGSHPGTGWLFAYILIGAYAGASNGGQWWGAHGGRADWLRNYRAVNDKASDAWRVAAGLGPYGRHVDVS